LPNALGGRNTTRTALPALCGITIVLLISTVNARSVDSVNTVLLTMFMRTVVTFGTVAEVGARPMGIAVHNILEDSTRITRTRSSTTAGQRYRHEPRA